MGYSISEPVTYVYAGSYGVIAGSFPAGPIKRDLTDAERDYLDTQLVPLGFATVTSDAPAPAPVVAVPTPAPTPSPTPAPAPAAAPSTPSA